MQSPLQARLLRAVDLTVDATGLFSQPLVASELIGRARARTGLDDFGEWSVAEALEVLVQAYSGESSLSTFGRIAARWDLLRFLSNLLRLRHEETRAPGIVDEPLERPLFVLGMPRSGTTFLHNLLAQDPANRAPRCWETIYPYPLIAGQNGRQRDTRVEIVRRKLSAFHRLVPEIRELHPLEAQSPQECTEITAQVLRSRRFDTTHHIPSYRRWLEAGGHYEAYRFHRRFLQHLQHQAGERRRWALKCPDHAFAWCALREAYPDARFVFVHRDPVRILASVAKLTEVVRRPFTRLIDRQAIGRQVCDDWADGAARLVAAARTPGLAPGAIAHVRYSELITAPIEVVARLYRHFDIEFGLEAERAMNDYLAQRPRGGYGRNSYRLAEFGLDPVAIRDRFRTYRELFEIEDEDRRGPLSLPAT